MKDKILKILDKVGERSLFPSEAYDAILDLIKEEVEKMPVHQDSEGGWVSDAYINLDDLLLKLEGKK